MNGQSGRNETAARVRPDVLLRTRRSVMEAALEMRARRQRQRRHAGIALAALGILVMLLVPVLWSLASDLTSGDRFMDMPVVIVTLTVILLSAIFAVLLMSWRDSQQGVRDE